MADGDKCEWCGRTHEWSVDRVYKCEICERLYCAKCSKKVHDFNFEHGTHKTLRYCIDCATVWEEYYPRFMDLRQKQELDREILRDVFYKKALKKASKFNIEDEMYIID